MNLSPYIWLTIGLVLVAVEVIVPHFVVFWFGIGGLITALLVFLGVLNTAEAQWLTFVVSSGVFLLLWFTLFNKIFKFKLKEDHLDPTLANLAGKALTKIEPHRKGMVELYDQFHGIKKWAALSSVMIEEGAEIVVQGAKGIQLYVAPKHEK